MDVGRIRGDFPLLAREVNGHALAYLDNAATSQLPQVVVDAVVRHLTFENANIHRGAHALGEEATAAYERARAQVAAYLGAPRDSHVIFTSGTTAAINLVARGIAPTLGPGDAVLTTGLEYHSNYLPWQQLAAERGAQLRVVGLDERGDLSLEHAQALLEDGRVALLALTACSNVTGAVTELRPFIEAAHRQGALVLVDAAQATRARCLDVAELGCDFLALSGHKMCAPTGIGALYGTAGALEGLRVSSFGGGMVDVVRVESADFSALPERLEAGTPNICGAVALGVACDYLQGVGLEAIRLREEELTERCAACLARVPGVSVLATPRVRCGAVSITHERLSSYDLARLMDAQGVEVRSGHHCAIPALEALGAKPTARISPAFYNTVEEVERAAAACARAVELLGRF